MIVRSTARSVISSAATRRIEVLSGDYQNKPDVGVNLGRQWLDSDKVDAIADTPNSGVARAVSNLVRDKNAVLLLKRASVLVKK